MFAANRRRDKEGPGGAAGPHLKTRSGPFGAWQSWRLQLAAVGPTLEILDHLLVARTARLWRVWFFRKPAGQLEIFWHGSLSVGRKDDSPAPVNQLLNYCCYSHILLKSLSFGDRWNLLQLTELSNLLKRLLLGSFP
jgi:hypothetical protein